MKLSRLESTTQHHAPDAVERANHAQAQQIRRVEALEAVVADRQRSLQQEMAELNLRAFGPFEGGELILEDARHLASRISHLDLESSRLIKPATGQSSLPPKVDENA